MIARVSDFATTAHASAKQVTLGWIVLADLAPTTAVGTGTVSALTACASWDGPAMTAPSRAALAIALRMDVASMAPATVPLVSWARHASKKCARTAALATGVAMA